MSQPIEAASASAKPTIRAYPESLASAAAMADAAVSGAAAPSKRPSPLAWLGEGASPLAERIAAFNRYPTRYAHASWIPAGWTDGWLDRFSGGSHSEARLGVELLRHWRLDARPCFDFGTPSLRLALVDAAHMRRVVTLAGLALHADGISRMLERAKVMELRNQIGEDAYRFAMFRAPLLVGSLGSTKTPRATQKAAASQTEGRETDWRNIAMASGLGMLGACLAGGSPSLTARVGLKFPREAFALYGALDGTGQAESYIRLFRKILIQEVDPAWDSLLS